MITNTNPPLNKYERWIFYRVISNWLDAYTSGGKFLQDGFGEISQHDHSRLQVKVQRLEIKD